MRNCRLSLATCLLLTSVLCASARSEVFHLKSGGRVEGDWLNRNESPLKRYIIRTADGGRIALPASDVHVPRRVGDAERKYNEIRAKFANTVEAQWKLAEFCRMNGLEKLREVHLRQILELDPDHDKSRKALGFIEHQGKWTTYKQKMKEQGYFLHSGEYRTRQEIAMVEQRKKINTARKSWIAKLKKWRGQLNDRNRAEETRDSILGITDPYAVEAIATMMKTERRREVKLLLVDALSNIKGHSSILVLARLSLDDSDREVRAVAREHLERLKSPVALDYFIRELKNKDNARINRAAKGLEMLGNESAVRPLIEALVTKHKFKVTRGKPGQLGGTFGGPGGGTFSSGGSTKIETKELYNGSVLDALRKLTGMDHGHDVATWRRSYAQERKLDYINPRRDSE